MSGKKMKKSSMMAKTWLNRVEKEENKHIRSAWGSSGEKRVRCRTGLYEVDGWHKASGTVYEFYGCFYHGCPTCFPDRGIAAKRRARHPDATVASLYANTKKRERELLAAPEVKKLVTKWQHELKEDLKKDKNQNA